MRLKKTCIILSIASAIIIAPAAQSSASYSETSAGVHYTSGGKEKGGSSYNRENKSNPSNDSKPNKTIQKGQNSGGNGKSGTGNGINRDGSGITTKDRIEVSEEIRRGNEQTSTSSSSKTVIDSYNWYFTNDGKLIPGLANDWTKKNDMKTTQNVSVTYYHSGHYIGIRHPNTHIETTVTTTTYEEVEYEYKDPSGNTVTGMRTEAIGSSSSTTSTPSKEDTSITYKEEWDVPITGCDIGEDCEPITVTTPVPKLEQAEYDFDLEMTN